MWISSAFSRHSQRYQRQQSVPWGPVSAIALTLVAFFVMDLLVAFAIFGLIGVGGAQESITMSQSVFGSNIVLFFVFYGSARLMALGIIYWFVSYRGGGLRELGYRSFSVLRALGVLAGSTLGFIAATVGAIALLQYVAPGVDINAEQSIPFLAADGTLELMLTFLALVVIAPLAEETIFRGFLLPGLGKYIGMWPAAILISIGFGLLHPPVVSMVVIGIFSFFLCVAYMETGSLWPSIMLHAGKNLIAFVALV